jgi:hypothetical protein
MYIYIHTYIHTYTYTHIYTHIYIICMYIYIHISAVLQAALACMYIYLSGSASSSKAVKLAQCFNQLNCSAAFCVTALFHRLLLYLLTLIHETAEPPPPRADFHAAGDHLYARCIHAYTSVQYIYIHTYFIHTTP